MIRPLSGRRFEPESVRRIDRLTPRVLLAISLFVVLPLIIALVAFSGGNSKAGLTVTEEARAAQALSGAPVAQGATENVTAAALGVSGDAIRVWMYGVGLAELAPPKLPARATYFSTSAVTTTPTTLKPDPNLVGLPPVGGQTKTSRSTASSAQTTRSTTVATTAPTTVVTTVPTTQVQTTQATTTTQPPASTQEGTFGSGGVETGVASYYDYIEGSCAHKTLPKGTVVKVTNLENGKSTTCVVKDRGPFIPGRIIDLETRVFAQIASINDGIFKVKIEW